MAASALEFAILTAARASQLSVGNAGQLSGEDLVGFRGGEAGSRDQARDKGAEQGFSAPARVVHELEEAEMERQLLL